jgi:squalene-hopene/tetraprenyl-beta-curcumene cyclase
METIGQRGQGAEVSRGYLYRAWPKLRRGERGFATELVPPVGASTLKERLVDGVERAARFLVKVQGEDGLWEGAVESGVSATARMLLLYERLGCGSPERVEGLAAFLRQTQLGDGGWATLEGEQEADLSSTVEAYWALKLAQDSPGAVHMVRARQRMKALGGIKHAGLETKFLLAMFGQGSWWSLPVIPLEVLLLAPFGGLSVERVAPWWQMAAVSLGVLAARRVAFRLPTWAQLGDVQGKAGAAVSDEDRERPRAGGVWRWVVGGAEVMMGVAERVPLKPLRAQALRAAERWLLERALEDGPVDFFGLMLGALTLHHLGYTQDQPPLRRLMETLEGYQAHEVAQGRWRQQVCSWALHDTLRAADGLRLAMGVRGTVSGTARVGGGGRGGSTRGSLERAVAATLKVFHHQPGALLSETTLTAFGARLLMGYVQDMPASAEVDRVLDHMLHSLLATQQPSGAWGRCDGMAGGPWLRAHALNRSGALSDDGGADVTGLVLEVLCEASYQGEPGVRKAVSCLLHTQQRDGGWEGRWRGWLYATAQAVMGLLAAGELASGSALRQAGDFLLRHQNVDGSWGEAIEESWRRGRYVSLGYGSPAQTAWAVRALVSLGGDYGRAAERGAGFLLETQHPAGFWLADAPSALSFQPHTRLRAHLDAVSEPLWALIALCAPSFGAARPPRT